MEKQIDSTTIYDGAIMKVTKEHVLLQDGNTAVRECVYHHGGVCILAIEDDEIILVKQFRYPNRCDTLEIPAGKLELGEDPDKACYREFEEETNRRAKNMRHILKMLPTPGYSSEILRIYEAEDFKEVEDSLQCDADEFLNIIKMPIDEAYKAIFDGRIIDGKTVIAVMYAYNRKHCK